MVETSVEGHRWSDLIESTVPIIQTTHTAGRGGTGEEKDLKNAGGRPLLDKIYK